MGQIRDIIPSLKRRQGVSEELRKVIRNLKKYRNRSYSDKHRIFGGFADSLFDQGLLNDTCPEK